MDLITIAGSLAFLIGTTCIGMILLQDIGGDNEK
jgi:hypothetical protein